VAKDSAEAVRWWLQSAQNGIAEAQNRMGYLYEYGLGVPQDFREAARYFNSAAEQKLAVSEYNLGHMYQYGQGVPRDYARAADLYGQVWHQLRTNWGWHMRAVPASPKMRLHLLDFSSRCRTGRGVGATESRNNVFGR